ncbi:MAG: hypothetical protein LBB45_00130 [Methanobrevibacter sp.]|nr:hypothetical protein [Candidatus Methanovirga basalitermitum]
MQVIKERVGQNLVSVLKESIMEIQMRLTVLKFPADIERENLNLRQEKQYFSLKEDEWLQYHLTLQMVT